MTVKLLIDVNLSPKWAPVLKGVGWPAVHWSDVGDPEPPDDDIMAWARQNRYAVFTHDLDFGAVLALSGASGPSVLQVRSQHVLPEHLSGAVADRARGSTTLIWLPALWSSSTRTAPECAYCQSECQLPRRPPSQHGAFEVSRQRRISAYGLVGRLSRVSSIPLSRVLSNGRTCRPAVSGRRAVAASRIARIGQLDRALRRRDR